MQNTRQSINAKDANTGGNGKPCWNAAVVISTPSRPVFQVPVITIERPVIVQNYNYQ